LVAKPASAVLSPLIAEGIVEFADARQAATHAEVRTQQGALVAQASSEWMLMSIVAAARLCKRDKSRLEQFVAAMHRPQGR
jgi:hypothetical protein